MSKEAMKLALEAMERYQVKRQDFDRFADEIAALREALAEQLAQQELVGWMTQARCFADAREFTEAEAKLYGWSAVYTSLPAQRTWVSLTDEEIMEIAFNFDVPSLVVRTVEAKLKEQNT